MKAKKPSQGINAEKADIAQKFAFQKKCGGAYGFKNSPPILGGVAEGRGGNWKDLFPNKTTPLIPPLN